MKQGLVEVQNLSKFFPTETGLLAKRSEFVHAVDDVSFTIRQGETLGLVGETGCGKSTLGRCILQLLRPSSGKVRFNFSEGEKIEFESSVGGIRNRRNSRRLRRHAQIVFQDPFSSMNPRMLIKDIVAEPILTHHIVKRERVEEVASSLLEAVGLNQIFLQRYPHELSGGQLQRIAIARAIAVSPEFIVLDEPTSSLDASVQGQVLQLLREIQRKLELTYLFISHNLSTVDYFCDRIAVMYLGKIVELSHKSDLFRTPLHPYTKSLLAAIPSIRAKTTSETAMIARGELPSPVDPPAGCRYHPRCPVAFDKCGWEPRDFINKYGQELASKVGGFGHKRTKLFLRPKANVGAPEVIAMVESLREKRDSEPLFNAIDNIGADSSQVVIDFREPSVLNTIEMDGRSVSCLLYAEGLSDSSNSRNPDQHPNPNP